MLQLKGFTDYRIKCYLKTEILFGIGRKHCRKRRKCWLPTFSPFPTMFSRGFFFQGLLKTLGKGEIACDKQFLLFPQCFIPVWSYFLPFFIKFRIVICRLFQFRRVYNLSFGKVLKVGIAC